VLRAKILLLLADGLSYEAIVDKLDTSAPTIGKWKQRFLRQGFDRPNLNAR
jgi:transposase